MMSPKFVGVPKSIQRTFKTGSRFCDKIAGAYGNNNKIVKYVYFMMVFLFIKSTPQIFD